MIKKIDFEKVTKEFMRVKNREHIGYLILKELFAEDTERKYFEEYYSKLLDKVNEYYNKLKEDRDNEKYNYNLRTSLFYIETLKYWNVYEYLYENKLIKAKLNKCKNPTLNKHKYLKLKDKIYSEMLTDKEILRIAKQFYISCFLSLNHSEYNIARYLKQEKFFIYHQEIDGLSHFKSIFKDYSDFELIMIREFYELQDLYDINFSDEIAYMNLLKLNKQIYQISLENFLYIKENKII